MFVSSIRSIWDDFGWFHHTIPSTEVTRLQFCEIKMKNTCLVSLVSPYHIISPKKAYRHFFSARHLHHEISLSPASNIRWTCWTHGPRGTNSWANRRANRRHPRSENCMLELLDCSTAIDTMHVSLYKRFGTYNNPRVLATYIYESNSCDNAILSLSLTKLGWTSKLWLFNHSFWMFLDIFYLKKHTFPASLRFFDVAILIPGCQVAGAPRVCTKNPASPPGSSGECEPY